jgi:hypothetical protein
MSLFANINIACLPGTEKWVFIGIWWFSDFQYLYERSYNLIQCLFIRCTIRKCDHYSKYCEGNWKENWRFLEGILDKNKEISDAMEGNFDLRLWKHCASVTSKAATYFRMAPYQILFSM